MHRDNAHLIKPALKEFESINRYWDRQHDIVAAKILPGELYVTKEKEIIVTILGSCISVCAYDKVVGIGGMNHFMLPVKSENTVSRSDKIIGEAARYGNYAMEHLLNEIFKNGGQKQRLEVKVFGGGKVMKNLSNIGAKNYEFVFDYLDNEGLRVSAQDVGDIYPRKVIFFAQTGDVFVKKLKTMHNQTIIEREIDYRKHIEHEPVQGDVELFG